MARLRLGIGAKGTILVSCLHAKDVISKAYPNYTKNDKVHGLVVVSEGPRSIHREEKVMVVFTHPLWEQQTAPFDCLRSIALPTSQKKGMNQEYSSHRLLQSQQFWSNRDCRIQPQCHHHHHYQHARVTIQQ